MWRQSGFLRCGKPPCFVTPQILGFLGLSNGRTEFMGVGDVLPEALSEKFFPVIFDRFFKPTKSSFPIKVLFIIKT